ncbi:hypothetical protein [Flavobacterium sp.]
MKKLFLSFAVVAALMVVSCKEKTEDKVEDATEAVGDDMHEHMDNAGHAIDSTATEVGKRVDEAADDVKDATRNGAAKVEQEAKEVKNDMK